MDNVVRKVLIVDDERDVCVYLSRLFEENGFRTTCAADGEEAMQAVERETPDLITLDLSMPKASGAHFYRTIKSRPGLARIPVVMVTGITGLGGSRDTERFYSTRLHVPPPEGFIAKPIDREKMLQLVHKLLARDQLETAAPTK